jgi:hypothetical protein
VTGVIGRDAAMAGGDLRSAREEVAFPLAEERASLPPELRMPSVARWKSPMRSQRTTIGLLGNLLHARREPWGDRRRDER